MRKYFVLVGLLLLAAGSALAQEFPKVETSPAFMYIHTPVSFRVPLTSPIRAIGSLQLSRLLRRDANY